MRVRGMCAQLLFFNGAVRRVPRTCIFATEYTTSTWGHMRSGVWGRGIVGFECGEDNVEWLRMQKLTRTLCPNPYPPPRVRAPLLSDPR